MAELVDALVSGTSVRKDVQVRVLFWAQKTVSIHSKVYFFNLFFAANTAGVSPNSFLNMRVKYD